MDAETWLAGLEFGGYSGGGAVYFDGMSAVAAASVTALLDDGTPAASPASGDGGASSGDSSVQFAGIVHPVPPTGYTEVQLDGYTYAPTTVYGSNIQTAWRYSTGLHASVALIDDGFDPATTRLYGDFVTALSRNFGVGGPLNIGEPPGGYHGTTTSGLIGDSGANGLPVGLAPNAAIIGVKVTFGYAPFSEFVQAVQYASIVSEVINNSWGFTGNAVGEPTDRSFAS